MKTWKYLEGFLSVRDPNEVVETEPSLLAAEIVFVVIFVALVTHALLCKRRDLQLLFLSSLASGWAIELLAILHPQLNNMWHAQATLMLLEQEEPVWMLCSYAWLLYTPTALVLTAGEMTSAPLFSALLATLLFYPVDIVGAKHLWWTWHNSDPLYEERDRFMPYASPLWIMTFTCALACCIQVVKKFFGVARSFFVMLLQSVCVGVLSNVLMHALMVLLYHAPKSMTAETEAPWGMRDGYRTFKLLCLAAASLELLIWGIKGRLSWSFPRLVQGEPVVLVYAAWTVVLAMIGAGILVKSQELEIFGLHQTIGDCEERESCFWGQAERYTYACVEEDFHRQNSGLFLFNCTEELPAAGTSWYTICGTKKKSQWIADLVFDGLLALAVVFIIGGLKLRTVSPVKEKKL